MSCAYVNVPLWGCSNEPRCAVQIMNSSQGPPLDMCAATPHLPSLPSTDPPSVAEREGTRGRKVACRLETALRSGATVARSATSSSRARGQCSWKVSCRTQSHAVLKQRGELNSDKPSHIAVTPHSHKLPHTTHSHTHSVSHTVSYIACLTLGLSNPETRALVASTRDAHSPIGPSQKTVPNLSTLIYMRAHVKSDSLESILPISRDDRLRLVTARTATTSGLSGGFTPKIVTRPLLACHVHVRLLSTPRVHDCTH